ncbi:type II secretion system protein [Candidatus Curtissbacteria bacterium]|nr:type II secretion system protein [Candidatus Curtissbacteria bacterium]
MPVPKRTGNKKQETGNKSSSLKFRVSSFKFKAAFTLIEFLVVLALLSLTIGSALLFLTNLIKGANQANIIAETKQNGQAVLDSLEKMIRNASDAKQIGAAGNNQIVLDFGNGQYLHIKGCIFDSSNDWIGVFQSSSMSAPTDAQFNSVTNRDSVSGVDVELCNFQVIDPSGGDVSPAIVNIGFVANQGAQAPSRRDFKAKVEFKTTISLRQYN